MSILRIKHEFIKQGKSSTKCKFSNKKEVDSKHFKITLFALFKVVNLRYIKSLQPQIGHYDI